MTKTFSKPLLLTGKDLTVEDVVTVARKNRKVLLSNQAIKQIEKARNVVEEVVKKKKIVYGITTGFGAFRNKVISEEDVEKLQENLILSHSTGVGNPFPEEVVRATLLIRANALSKGNSGVRVEVVQTLIEMLNKGVHPVIPEKGSVGSSGDLAPMSHLSLVMIGKGEAFYKGKRLSGAEVLKKANITPLKLKAKEGLALINGTSVMTGVGVLAIHDAERLCEEADKNGALAIEALRGTPRAFNRNIHEVRPHQGQMVSAENISKLLKGSNMVDWEKVQDQYSLRCIPQVHGTVRDAVNYVKEKIEIEINSATDNPLIFPEDPKNLVISGGNFHGEPIAIAMDLLGIAVAELANIADRRLASMLDPNHNGELPAFLIPNGGLNSGLMILQYTTAALVSENKILAHPASVDSIPTSANTEDHVSMGTIAARKAADIVNNTRIVLAIERIGACQAIEFRLKEKLALAKETEKIYQETRKVVPFFEKDTVYYPHVQKLTKTL
jgi:histidine ammonia-lyase